MPMSSKRDFSQLTSNRRWLCPRTPTPALGSFRFAAATSSRTALVTTAWPLLTRRSSRSPPRSATTASSFGCVTSTTGVDRSAVSCLLLSPLSVACRPLLLWLWFRLRCTQRARERSRKASSTSRQPQSPHLLHSQQPIVLGLH